MPTLTTTSSTVTNRYSSQIAGNTKKSASNAPTFKMKGENSMEQLTSALLDQVRKGDVSENDLKDGNKIHQFLPLDRITLDQLKIVAQTQPQIKNDVSGTVAILSAQGLEGKLTVAASKRIAVVNQDSTASKIATPQPQASQQNASATVNDKVARVIELAKKVQNDYPNQISTTQIDQICEELTSGKEQLNLLDGWDATVDSFKSVIDCLESYAGKELSENNSLKAQLSELENTRNTLLSTIENLKNDINGASGNEKQHKQALAQLGNEIAALQGSISHQLEHISGQDKDIAALKRQLVDCDETISNLTTDKAALEKQLYVARAAGNSADVAGLERKILVLENQKKSLLEDYDNLDANYHIRKAENDALENEKSNLTESNKTQAATISDLEEKLHTALLKREKSGKHTAELIAGIAGLIASTALFLVALLPKDSVSEESSTDTVDTSDLKAELQSVATDLQAQIAQDDAAIADLNDIQDKLSDFSAAIEEQEASLTEEEDARIKEAGDKAYQQALEKAEAEAFKDPANQAFEVNADGVIVPTGELTAEAQAQCEAQATTEREAAEAQEKQNIDAQLQRAGQLDSHIQAASSNTASAADRLMADEIANQAELDRVNASNSLIPSEIDITTTNIENTNKRLSTAGFATTVGTAFTLGVGGTALIGKYFFGVRKHKDVENTAPQTEINSEMEASEVANEDADALSVISGQASGTSEINSVLRNSFNFLDDPAVVSDRSTISEVEPGFYRNNRNNSDAF
ncbi:TPA: hypothetical protein QCH65_001615 [Enterobacter roggenkampii]|nr:hypothetical protein [Enterobacter roggenkampii]